MVVVSSTARSVRPVADAQSSTASKISGGVVVPPDHGWAFGSVELTRPGARSREEMVGQRDPAGLEVVLVLKAGPCIRPNRAEHDEPNLDA